MCMCLARGGVGGEGVSGWEDWVWTLPILWNRGSVGRVSVFWLRWCRWGVCRGLGPGSGGVVLCLCEVRVWIICVDGRSMYLCIVPGG